MPTGVNEVLLDGEVLVRPALGMAEEGPQRLAIRHHRVVVLDDVVDGDGPDAKRFRLEQRKTSESSGKKAARPPFCDAGRLAVYGMVASRPARLRIPVPYRPSGGVPSCILRIILVSAAGARV